MIAGIALRRWLSHRVCARERSSAAKRAAVASRDVRDRLARSRSRCCRRCTSCPSSSSRRTWCSTSCSWSSPRRFSCLAGRSSSCCGRCRHRRGDQSRARASSRRISVARWSALTAPFDAWLIHGLAIWVWHFRVCSRPRLQSEAVHAAQHIVLRRRAPCSSGGRSFTRAARGARDVDHLSVHDRGSHRRSRRADDVARVAMVSAVRDRAAAFGLTPLGDQQLAGMVMWIPASFAYLGRGAIDSSVNGSTIPICRCRQDDSVSRSLALITCDRR